MMREIRFSVPDQVAVALSCEPPELAAKLRPAAAMKLYEMGEMSSGSAAMLAGIPRTLFLTRLVDYSIDTFRMSKSDLEAESSLDQHYGEP